MSVAADRRTRFDRAYYQRYYFDPHTAVASRSEMRARARLIAALVAHVGLPVRRILEAGCGTGMLRTELRRLLRARTTWRSRAASTCAGDTDTCTGASRSTARTRRSTC